MSQAKVRQMAKSDFELLFKDSPEYFLVENAKMLQEGALVRFICFDSENNFKKDLWFPVGNLHRISRTTSN